MTLTFRWKDSLTDAIGWVVFDSIINEMTGGGIFMRPDATEKETRDRVHKLTKGFPVPGLGSF